MYSYWRGKRNRPKSIYKSYLKLYECGLVEYFGLYHRKSPVYGNAEILDNNLTIHLSEGSKRVSYISIKTIDQRISISEEVIYVGVMVGLTSETMATTATRVILKKAKSKNFEAKEISFNSKEFWDIPDAIRKNLVGRINNFIGFVREKGGIFDSEGLMKEHKNEIKFNNIFFENACFHAYEGNYNRMLQSLIRAIEHGMSNKKQILEKIAEIDEELHKKLIVDDSFVNILSFIICKTLCSG